MYSGMFPKTSTRQNSLVFRATRPVLSGSPTCPFGLGQISRWVIRMMMMVSLIMMVYGDDGKSDEHDDDDMNEGTAVSIHDADA